MPLEPFRFLHTANLFLDHQLRGVGPIADPLREEIEQATMSAWDRIVDAAIGRQVDFMLLAGNCFDAADHTLPGQVALVHGLEKLGEHDIPVFIVPGQADPDTAWRLGLALPDNVTRFGGELSEPIDLSRDGRPFCTLHHVMANIRDLNASDDNGLDELAVFAPQISANDAGPFDIALLESISNDSALPPELIDTESANSQLRSGSYLKSAKPAFDPSIVANCPIEYWALGDGLRRQTWRVGRGMAHSPGSPQGLSAVDTGALGCTLVEVESDGRIRDSFLPTARVRWENVPVTLNSFSTRDSVTQQIRAALEAIPRTSQDELWLVTWLIAGSGSIYEDLQDQERAVRFWNDATQGIGGQSPQLHLRKVRYSNPLDLHVATDFLSQEYARQLGSWGTSSDLRDRVVAASALADGPWAARLKTVLADVDPQDALLYAHRLGWTWLKTGM